MVQGSGFMGFCQVRCKEEGFFKVFKTGENHEQEVSVGHCPYTATLYTRATIKARPCEQCSPGDAATVAVSAATL